VVKRIRAYLCAIPSSRGCSSRRPSLSRLNPNTFVLELGAVDKEYFIAMGTCGGTCQTMRTLGPGRTPRRAGGLRRPGDVRALAYAHDLTGDDGELLGMIHRDVSPST
jgi:hypothetical protein